MSESTEKKPVRRVLIVSPHFPPVNAPDMQRTRLAVPYLRSFGWEPVVLALQAEMVEGAVIEPLLEDTYPADVRIIRVKGWHPSATRWAGVGSLWFRCGRAFRKAGDKLLASEKFDLVFFSTTQFQAFALGPRWKTLFGVPYVLDYQDPWVNDYYSKHHTKPPGGWIKYAFSQWLAKRIEPGALRGSSGVVAVSGAYGATLSEQYPWYKRDNFEVISFGAAAPDFVTARKHVPKVPLIDFRDGLVHHVYTGRCGPDMSTSLALVFTAFKKFLALRPEEARRIRFHFIGTDYAPRPLGREWAMPVARQVGVEEYVHEECYRVPYFDALYYLVNADALVGVGSNDPTYSASKIYPYVLAERPMILVFNHKSPIITIAEELGCGMRYSFGKSDVAGELSTRIAQEWFLNGGMSTYTGFDHAAFESYTAEGMTRSLAACFDRAVAAGSRTP
jgi:hypothetical protein